MISTVGPSKATFCDRRPLTALTLPGRSASGHFRLLVFLVLIVLSHFSANLAKLVISGEETTSRYPAPTEIGGSSGPIPRTQAIQRADDQVFQSPLEEILPVGGRIVIRSGRYTDRELYRGISSWLLADEVENRHGNAISYTACA